MFKQLVSLVTIACLLAPGYACYRIERVPPPDVPQDKIFHVGGVVTSSGEKLTFYGATARVERGLLTIWKVNLPVRLARADIVERAATKDREITFFRTDSGRQYWGRVESEERSVIKLTAFTLALPAAEVAQVSVAHASPGRTVGAVLGGTLLLVGGLFAIALAMKQSCPFVYSFDGRDYVFDAEPYGGATAPGLKRTEWDTLESLVAYKGEYRLRLTNEVNETQYTDELKLLVIDHPATVTAVPDEAGTIHAIAPPLPPTTATDGHGRDILPLVGEKDWASWQTLEGDVDPAFSSGTKEDLVFTFPKPPGATRAKLVFNGANTLWASSMVKHFLSLHGTNLGAYYASLSVPGPTLLGLQAFVLREELYRLHVRVQTDHGWVSKGTMVGGGPFVSEDRVYVLDVRDVPGDTLRIRLTPPVGFWMINAMAVDYSADVALAARELEAAGAVDPAGRDLRPLLSATDNRYLVFPNTGDRADVVFTAPPQRPGFARTLVLKTSGYYDIHMGPLGAPQTEMLARIRNEPGFAVRVAWSEYLKWKHSLRAGDAR